MIRNEIGDGAPTKDDAGADNRLRRWEPEPPNGSRLSRGNVTAGWPGITGFKLRCRTGMRHGRHRTILHFRRSVIQKLDTAPSAGMAAIANISIQGNHFERKRHHCLAFTNPMTTKSVTLITKPGTRHNFKRAQLLVSLWQSQSE